MDRKYNSWMWDDRNWVWCFKFHNFITLQVLPNGSELFHVFKIMLIHLVHHVETYYKYKLGYCCNLLYFVCSELYVMNSGLRITISVFEHNYEAKKLSFGNRTINFTEQYQYRIISSYQMSCHKSNIIYEAAYLRLRKN